MFLIVYTNCGMVCKCSDTLRFGGHKTMESACQVKGCQKILTSSTNNNITSTANNNNNNNNYGKVKSSKKLQDDSGKIQAKNNLGNVSQNSSDDENNDDVINRKSTKKSNKSTLSNSNITNPANNNNNIVNNKNKINKLAAAAAAASSNDSVSYSKIVSPNKTTDLAYNKVVSNGLASVPTTNDLSYNKVVSNGLVSSTTTTTTTAAATTMTPAATATSQVTASNGNSSSSSSIPYNKIVSIGRSAAGSDHLAYNKVVLNGLSATTTTNELTYNKVVSNGLAATTTPVTATHCDSPYRKVVGGGASPRCNELDSSSDTNDALINTGLNNLSLSNDCNNVRPNVEASAVVDNAQQQQQAQSTNTTEVAASTSPVQQRHAVLNYEQVCRLNDVINEVVSIHGRGNFPTIEVKLRDLVTVVMTKLEADPSVGGAGMKVRDVRLNGGAASHVFATDAQPYNDLDLIFGVELNSSRNYDRIKAAVLGSLFDLLPEGVSRKRITTCSLKEAYVSKMVKVNNNDGDRWSLISLGNSRGHRNVELKFVDSMRRQFEFSVDSFQIVLDTLLFSKLQISEGICPTVVGESVYGDFNEALYHLQNKLISTRHPEEIRGGGLLKYCNLLVKMYKPAQPDYIKTLERYMCSRFFIDFPDISQQRAKLENYLWNHFVGPEEEALKYQYLMLLHSVVEESTVCLMGHERRQTLALIENLAYQVLCQEQQQQMSTHPAPAPAYVYAAANGYYYAPIIPAAACYTCTCNSSWMAACSS
ncbi:uncharacterized protein LOC106656271 isoform X1 [Trichogramma pretiosum]|uniref:uncharacterized protein LOC106656271 isoform X1 n=2 Tax=Trichogramma pretiosum TaxID=7493 RepID=UPI0006C9D1BD|nr:uncharacterized protein LOC106656271 isoform X1 [Trichogramma pretiosum]